MRSSLSWRARCAEWLSDRNNVGKRALEIPSSIVDLVVSATFSTCAAVLDSEQALIGAACARRSPMATSPSPSKGSSARIDHWMPNMHNAFTRAMRPSRTMAKAAIFFLKVFPMLPSRPVDWVTKPPLIEKVSYPTRFGQAEGDLYRPSAPGPHPGIVVCLGVVPFGVDHPQVPVLGKALARAGFAALLYWSPAMRDFRLDPEDIENIPLHTTGLLSSHMLMLPEAAFLVHVWEHLSPSWQLPVRLYEIISHSLVPTHLILLCGRSRGMSQAVRAHLKINVNHGRSTH